MAVRVKPDIIKGTTAGATLLEIEVTRVFQVTGLGGLPAEQVIGKALTAVDSVNPAIRVPSLGDRHPAAEFSGCIVVDRRTESDPHYDAINVYVRYRWRLLPGLYLKSVHGTLRQIDIVAKNPDGSRVELEYQRPGSSNKVKYPVIYKKQLLSGTTSFKFFETVDPEFFNNRFAGGVNLSAWRGYAPRTLMILPMEGSSDDNVWYSNLYTFWYRPETHDEYVFFVDASTGQIPVDVARDVVYDGSRYSGNGWVRFKYANPLYNFQELFPNIGNAAPLSYGLIGIIGAA